MGWQISKYQMAVQWAIAADERLWQTYGAFLLTQTIFLGFILDGAFGNEACLCARNVGIFLAGTVGFLLCLPWMSVLKRGAAYSTMRLLRAREIEPQGWSLIKGCGQEFAEGKPVESLNNMRMPWSARIMCDATAATLMIVVFAVAYLLVMFLSGPWWRAAART